jgi:thiol-disulfide isomerase/thioredoxin
LAVKSSKGESAWRFLVRQNGAQVAATILRIDGDTGELAGRYQDGKYVLSHFSGARPALLIVEPDADGSLHLLMNGATEYTAVRPETAQAEGLPTPTDPEFHTGVKDPSERFLFAFPDVNGKLVTNNDPRFEDKVVVVSILGSWCPNCHDEAPFLAALYRKYHEQGLEIVGLSFEEAEQLADPVRLRAFVKKYGIEYPVLLCGMPEQATEKMPQLDNFNAWPTTLFLGRDGRVKMVHAGFPSVGSGEVYEQTKKDVEAEVERLLAEN